MDDIHARIQVYLIKKDRECGPLRFLTSETTTENAENVSDVCATIKRILTASQDPSKPETKKMDHLKFLLLNTNFRSQEYLCEDIVNGHLVDMCPPISPYLFIRLTWNLRYEDILCDYIPHLPMDLCAEILDVVRRCLALLDFHRATDVTLKLICNSYSKIVQASHAESQALDEQHTLDRYVANIQELAAGLCNLHSKLGEDFKPMAKYEAWGLAFKKLVRSIHACFMSRESNCEPSTDKALKISFSREWNFHFDTVSIEEHLDALDKDFAQMLWKHVEPIDVYMYLSWAEIDDASDPLISMQRTIGIDCYHFLEFLRRKQDSEEFKFLIDSLQQMSSTPTYPASMSLPELRNRVDTGDTECLKRFLNEHSAWTDDDFACLEKNHHLVDEKLSLNLLNLAVQGSSPRFTETSLRVLLRQNLPNTVEIVARFLLKHFGTRSLELESHERDLDAFIRGNSTLCSDAASLKVILFYLIQNPKRTLDRLAKVAVGLDGLESSLLLPENFCKLSVFLQIRDEQNCRLVHGALSAICAGPVPWNGKKFIALVKCLLEKGITTPDDLLDEVFVRCLDLDTVVEASNLHSITGCLRTMSSKFSPASKKHELMVALARRMTRLRRSEVADSKNSLDPLIGTIRRFQEVQGSPTKEQIAWMINRTRDLEPIDKGYLTRHWDSTTEMDLARVLDDYARRCEYVLTMVGKCGTESESRSLDVIDKCDLKTSDYLTDLLTKSTESEYQRFAKEAVLVHWDRLGWSGEMDALTNFGALTVQLEKLDKTNQENVVTMKSFTKFVRWFASLEECTDYKSAYEAFLAALCTSEYYRANLRKIDLDPTRLDDAYGKILDLARQSDELSDQRSSLVDSSTELRKKLHLINVCLNWTPRDYCEFDSKFYPLIRPET